MTAGQIFTVAFATAWIFVVGFVVGFLTGKAVIDQRYRDAEAFRHFSRKF